MKEKVVRVIIPAFNEERSVDKVIKDIPQTITEIVVVDNGSTDNTGEVAEKAGAVVLKEMRKGYGMACLKGIAYISGRNPPTDIVVFMDADYSDHPEELFELVHPILENRADMVIGSRSLGVREKGSMTIPQVFGNWLATRLIRLFYGVQFTDLGPFRAISMDALTGLEMKDQNYGWTVEMQLKAARKKLRCMEVPVSYRRRIGQSKVSGTVKGTILAGYKIIFTIFRHL